MTGRRRRPGPARPSWWTVGALAAGVTLVLVGAGLQFHEVGPGEYDVASAGELSPADALAQQASGERTGVPQGGAEQSDPDEDGARWGATGQGSAQPGDGHGDLRPGDLGQDGARPGDMEQGGARPGDVEQGGVRQRGGGSVRPEVVVVPRLGIWARVVAIRASGGGLRPPADPRLVGWWAGGARVGAPGAAVIAGHTVHSGGGAFDDLDRMRRGDAITVRGGGTVAQYVVSQVTVYRKKAFAAQASRLLGQSGSGRLVLITCEDWDGTAYLSNAVVVAVPRR